MEAALRAPADESRRMLIAAAIFMFVVGLALAILTPHGVHFPSHPSGVAGPGFLDDFHAFEGPRILLRTGAALFGAVTAAGLLMIAHSFAAGPRRPAHPRD